MSVAGDCADVHAVDFSYPFLAGIDPANPPPSIVIPSKYMDAMANMERQYWEIKAKRYNVLIFFKKGKFYELYDYDAVIANKEFGLKMVFDTTNRGKMRLAGVPEQSLSEWSRLFVFRGYKVGRVEQMVKSAEEESAGASSKAKIVPRELVEVLTPGTLTDAAMLSDHSEIFLLALAPQPQAGVVDAFAVDLSRRVVHWCPCGTASAVRRYRDAHEGMRAHGTAAAPVKEEGNGTGGPGTAWAEAAMRSVTALLQQLHPREVVMPDVSTTHKAGAVFAHSLVKWVQADGFMVEQVKMCSRGAAWDSSSRRDGSNCDSRTFPTARETIAEYLCALKLERELPLLDEATPYAAHVFSSTSATPAAHDVEDAREGPGRTPSIVEWERRFAEGLVLDSATVSNLEIVTNLLDGTEKQSLHQCLNHCITNGGKRLFRAWLLRPSASARVIQLRQDAVKFILDCGLASHNELWGQCGHDRGGGRGPGSQPGVTCTPQGPSSANGTHDSLSPSPAAAPPTPSLGGLKRPREESDSSAPGSQRSARGCGSAHFLARFGNMLSVDFERSLSRLAEIRNDDQHQTISYVDPLVKYHKNLGIILSCVQAFSEMVEWATQFHALCRRHRSQRSISVSGSMPSTPPACSATRRETEAGAIPALVEELLLRVEAAAESVTAMEKLFDRRVAAETGLLTPAPGTSAAFDTAVEKLAGIEAKLHAYKRRAQHEVFADAPVNFVDVGKDLFLLEVAPSAAPKMTPPGMVERARSGKSVKYVVEALEALVKAHKEATAAKSASLLMVLQNVAEKMCAHCPVLHAATSALSYLDCLINLARLTHRFPNTTFPQIMASAERGAAAGSSVEACGGAHAAFIEAKELVHPLLTSVNSGGGGAVPVPNAITLDEKDGRLLVLTGPNMAGKSTLMRTVAVSVIMAQLGGPVLAAEMRMAAVSRIFTRIGARDATQKGQSTLYVELNETAEILRSANGRSLCLIDELGRGTSTHDGLAIAHATLQALKTAATPPLTIFSTHYHSLALEQARCAGLALPQHAIDGARQPRVQLGYMDFALTGGSDSKALMQSSGSEQVAAHSSAARRASSVPKITFLYRLVPGICDRSYGVEVAQMAGVSPALVEVARDKSAELATRTALHEDLETIQRFLRAGKPDEV